MEELRRREGYKQKGKGKERRWDDKDADVFPSPEWKRKGERYILLIARCQKGDTKYWRWRKKGSEARRDVEGKGRGGFREANVGKSKWGKGE